MSLAETERWTPGEYEAVKNNPKPDSVGIALDPKLVEMMMKRECMRDAPRSPHQNVLLDLPLDADARKRIPLFTGLLDYFPMACAEVAALSLVANEQHNPGEPLHWARGKSADHADTIVRHLMQRGTRDIDGVRHAAKAAWRALALLQEEIERERGFTPS